MAYFWQNPGGKYGPPRRGNPLRPRFVPRAGIADPRVRQAPRPMVPPRPDVREPAAWSWAVQQLVGQAEHAASESMVEQESGDLKGWAALRADVEMEKRIFSDPETKREFYERAVHLIGRDTPMDGWSKKGPSVDRAEARLRLWNKLFEEYEGSE